MEIIQMKLNLITVSKEFTIFDCEDKVSGVIHTTSDGKSTIILDGGYVLGNFECSHCAVKAISLLAVKICDGEKAGFGSYSDHKRKAMERVSITVH